MKLLRKITHSKWREWDEASIDNIPADALTVCMRTKGNTLSFWRVDDENQNKALLALLGSLQQIESIDVVYVDSAALEGVELISTPGETAFKDLADLHVDVTCSPRLVR